jgi:hypothetical protein
VLIRFSAETIDKQLVDDLLRLGCTVDTVDTVDAQHLHVRIRYPDTVEDETRAVHDWCTTWENAGHGDLLVEDELTA